MDVYRLATRLVATCDLLLLGIHIFLWALNIHLNRKGWTDASEVILGIIILGYLLLLIMASILLLLATRRDKPPTTAIKLCNFWQWLNLSCVFSSSLLFFLTFWAMYYNNLVVNWMIITPMIAETIYCLLSAWIVENFMRKLKSSLSIVVSMEVQFVAAEAVVAP